MALVIRAIYEKGHLRLIDPVSLVEGQEVEVTVQVEPKSEEERVREALGDLVVSWPDPTADPYPEVEAMAEEIDLAFRGDPPLSEMIIEDRGEA